MMQPPARIDGRYRLDARLGGGGMADVFEAYDEQLGRPVALKLLRGIDDDAAAHRFAQEIRLTARVNHPNIVQLFDAGEHDGAPYLVLERVSGGTLAGEMDIGAIDPRRVAAVGEQLASALSHAHAAGIVHRDVKPTNILLAPGGCVRLADFGIATTATAARLTVAGTITGSAGYVSPEQVLGSGAGTASDVYALGLVLLECLAGAPPWSGTTVEVALARITSDPYIPDDLPHGWQPLLAAMTARDPGRRPHIDLVGHALSRLANDQPYDTALVTPPAPPADGRIPAVAAMSALVLLVSAVMVLAGGAPGELAVADGPPAVDTAAGAVPVWEAVAPRVAPTRPQHGVQRETARQETARQRRAAARRPAASAATTTRPAAPAAPARRAKPSTIERGADTAGAAESKKAPAPLTQTPLTQTTTTAVSSPRLAGDTTTDTDTAKGKATKPRAQKVRAPDTKTTTTSVKAATRLDRKAAR